ncbi:hypothetical protein [Mycobacteroides chelonae]|uniref:hypothetical protein n=1 Tax=Mycobacteroides chelonae TaxID=1774 RepID=UPI00099271FA|nr:hypothetical protein [Mycobacteroides chelonae]
MSWGAVSPLMVEPREVELPTYNFTGADVVAEIRRLAARFPEGVAQCTYVVNDRPHCIGGRALANLGLPLGDLGQCEGTALDTVMSRLRIESTYDERRWARVVQGSQDGGRAWAKAVNYADCVSPISEVTP